MLLKSPGDVGNKDYYGFNHSLWTKRNNTQHRRAVQQIIKCKTKTSQSKMENKIESGFSSFKANQFKSWILTYSIPALHNL